MALEMRDKCEKCGASLGLQDDAYICSYECTFCPTCASAMNNLCPNCGGELVSRPKKSEILMTKFAIPDIFKRHPETATAYADLVRYAHSLGKCVIEEKKTCAHVVAGKSAFLGLHPRKEGLRITIVLSRSLSGKSIVKCEKASAKRYHVDVDLKAASGLGDELKQWIAEAYARSTS